MPWFASGLADTWHQHPLVRSCWTSTGGTGKGLAGRSGGRGDAAGSLRERRRAELLAQVKESAQRKLAAEGAAALSLRAVARDVGIAVSALYYYCCYYYANRDALLTELSVDAFDAQADAVEQAVAAVAAARERDPENRIAALRAGFLAYRQWSREHPAEFGLCYGTPVPSYTAPAERTVTAGTWVSDQLIALVGEAAAAGQVDPDVVAVRAAVLTPVTAAQLDALRERRGYPVPLPLLAVALDAFIRLHGFVAMEVIVKHRPIAPEPDALFGETLDDALRRLGFPATGTTDQCAVQMQNRLPSGSPTTTKEGA